MVYKDTDDRIFELDEVDVMAAPDTYYDEARMETFGEAIGDNALKDAPMEDNVMEHSSIDEELAGDETIKTTDPIEKGFGEAIGPDNTHIGDQLDDDKLASEAEADFSTHDDDSIMKDKTIEE